MHWRFFCKIQIGLFSPHLDFEIFFPKLLMMCIWHVSRYMFSPKAKVAQLQKAPCTDSPPHTPTLHHKPQLEVVPSVIGQTILRCPLP